MLWPCNMVSHWKWYEQAKSSEWYHHAKFDIYHTYGVWIHSNVQVFNKSRHLTDKKKKKVQLSPLRSVKQIILCIIYLKVYSNHTDFKLQSTRIQNTQFAAYISQAAVTLKQCQGNQTYNDNVDPKKVYNPANVERSHFFPQQGNMSITTSLEHVHKSKIVAYSWST